MNFEGRQRVTIQNVEPEIDGGAFPVKRVVGEKVVVSADVFADGHDQIEATLLYRRRTDSEWRSLPMLPLGNDRWEAAFNITERVPYCFTVEGHVDRFLTWQKDLRKKTAAGQNIAVDLLVGRELLEPLIERAEPSDRKRLESVRDSLQDAKRVEQAVTLALSDELTSLNRTYADRSLATRYEKELPVEVDRKKAAFSTWYEFFPRSFAAEPGRHGTFREAEKQLPRIADMGFDVVYLPPIHPIGTTNRKGKNNSVKSAEGDPGSPWAIGSKDGGHKAVHPDLGTLEDFRHFLKAAEKLGVDIALDIAFQCSPDHPYVREHPEWFLWRPDGSIQFAENPPKKYEDIVPFNFETDAWQSLWKELKSVITYWAQQGVRIFRIDNPHTKPFPFWKWLIEEVRGEYPDTIFLAEAFTRPQVMGRLAKVGFTQSYTYFTWRNNKSELMGYLTELTRTEAREYFRPNFWPNTPDILPEFLQYGGRSAFLIRQCLAATLSSNYGMYGPAFELCESQAIEGKEEYLNSEKYEIKNWELDRPGNIRPIIRQINHIRRENEALQQTWNLRFYPVDNDFLLFYGKATEDYDNILLMIVNLDPFHKQTGWVRVPLREYGMDPKQPYLMHDLLSDDRFIWQGEENYVELDPAVIPFHIFRIRRRLRREYDFDYYM